MYQAGNCLRVSLVVLKINKLWGRISIELQGRPLSTTQFSLDTYCYLQLAQSCILLEQFHILGNTVVWNLPNFGGNGCR